MSYSPDKQIIDTSILYICIDKDIDYENIYKKNIFSISSTQQVLYNNLFYMIHM